MKIYQVTAKTDRLSGVVQKTSNGDIKYKVEVEGDDRNFVAYGDWILAFEGKELDTTSEDKVYMNRPYTVLHTPKASLPSLADKFGDVKAEVLKTPPVAPKTVTEPYKSRDYEPGAEGKCRHGYLLVAFEKDLPLTKELLAETSRWTEASMTGKFIESVTPSEPEEEAQDEPEEEINVKEIPF